MKHLILLCLLQSSALLHSQKLQEDWLSPDNNWSCVNCNFRQMNWSELDSLDLYLEGYAPKTGQPGVNTVTFWAWGDAQAYFIDMKCAGSVKTFEVSPSLFAKIKPDTLMISEEGVEVISRIKNSNLWDVFAVTSTNNHDDRIFIQHQENGLVRLFRNAPCAESSDLDEMNWKIDRRHKKLLLTNANDDSSSIVYEVQQIKKDHILLIKRSPR